MHSAARMVLVAALGTGAVAQDGQVVSFENPRWDLSRAKIVDHLGRKALMGSAFLREANFQNGVIEFDVAASGERSYPGVIFRMAGPGAWERVYLRPHHANSARVPDVVQYVAAFNGVDAWQLYHGEGKTAFAELPTHTWVHVKLEVSGTQARVFLGGAETPVLRIHDLQRGLSTGALGLMGPVDGSAWFSNFSYRANDKLNFEPPPPMWAGPGFLENWELSQALRGEQVDEDRPLSDQKMPPLRWKPVKALASGLVDVSRHLGRLGPGTDCVVARTKLFAMRDEVRKLRFGYSDAIAVFLNGRPVFSGNSSYLSRDPSFPGFLGLQDALHLPLRAGENDLVIYLYESSGGWGFAFQEARAEFLASGITRLWETPFELPFAESAIYDPAREVLYVSCYDALRFNPTGGAQTIAKLDLQGHILNHRWAEGLSNPTGLALKGDTLFAIEPTSIAELDAITGKLRQRHPVPGAMMLNKTVLGDDGALFITDSRRGCIWRFAEGKAEVWLEGLLRPNALHVKGGNLYVGTNGDGTVKAVDLKTRALRTLAHLGQGILVGLGSDGQGNLLVSQVEGRLFRIAPDGAVTRLIDTTVPEKGLCAFTFIPEKHLLVAPTWSGNGARAYRTSW